MTAAAPIVVIGVGNRMRGDDGVGLAVARSVTAGAGVEVVELDGEPSRLIETWWARRLAVVVDAVVSGAPPGTVHEVIVGEDELPGWSAARGSHAAGLAEAVALARRLDRMPDRLVILGVEPADLDLGEGLSPAVAAAVPTVVARLREMVAVGQSPA